MGGDVAAARTTCIASSGSARNAAISRRSPPIHPATATRRATKVGGFLKADAARQLSELVAADDQLAG